MFRRIGNLFRLVWAVIAMSILGVAAVGAYLERTALENNLPTRIGEKRIETTYWQDVQAYATNMWVDFYLTYLPGLVPGPVAQEQTDPTSLEALKMRTRNQSSGRATGGGISISNF